MWGSSSRLPPLTLDLGSSSPPFLSLCRRLKKNQTLLCWQGPYSQSYGFSSNHVWMWELDYKEGWALKHWYFWTVLLEKTLENPLDCKEIKPVNPKGNQSRIFTGGTVSELKFQYFGYLMWRTDSLEKTMILGKIWRQEEKGMTEDTMVG